MGKTQSGMADWMTNTYGGLQRLATDWLQAPADWPPLTESERQAMARRLEDAQQPDDGKDTAS